MAGGLSFLFNLDIEKKLFVATARMYLQLFALGYILRFVFSVDSWAMVLLIMLCMLLFAGWTVNRRINLDSDRVFIEPFLSMLLSGSAVVFSITLIILRVKPWYLPQYTIPIAGMVIGNSMNGIALSLEIMFADMKKRTDEVNAMLSIGASPWEVSLDSIRHAIYTAMIPTINSMLVVGVVFIPGMMTGQVLAGADPASAAKYQIVVMLMISASTALASIICLLLAFRSMFNNRAMFTL